MKNGLFSRIISLCNSLVQNCQNIYAGRVPRVHRQKRLDDDATGW